VIWVWPPLNGNSLEIFTWGQLAPPTTLAAPFAAPPGYGDLVVWMLAKRLYYMVNADVLPHKIPYAVLIAQASKAADKVRAINAPMPRMSSDFGSGRGGNAPACDWGLLLTGIPY
jgi:hypothetical protein